MAEFGEILEELRKDHGLTQKEFGEILHVSPGTISNYENNANFPGVDRLIAMADFFQVSIDYLLGRSSSPLSPENWNQAVLGNQTVGSLVEMIRSLSQEQQNALALVLNDMVFRAAVTQYQNRQEENP